MNIIDLRILGCISVEEETFLSELIAKSCSKDNEKHQMSLYAKEDFGWDNGVLMPYVLANLITLCSYVLKDIYLQKNGYVVYLHLVIYYLLNIE